MFVSARWGLIPYWMKDPNGGYQPINARAEEVKTKPMFKAAYQKRRALMPIDGFFEWKDILGTDKNKQPYAIAMKSGEPLALAALWEMWKDPATGDNVRTFTVLTCEPNALMATIHNRMPVILSPSDYMTWLTDPDPEHLMKPFPAELMTMWKIGRDVGNPRNNRPDLLDEVKDDLFDA